MGITREDVRSALEQAKQEGLPESAGSLRALIGGGSKSTIEKRKAEIYAESVPSMSAVPERFLKEVNKLWGEMVTTADDNAQSKAIGLVMAAEERAAAAEAESVRLRETVRQQEITIENERAATAVAVAATEKLQDQLTTTKVELASVERCLAARDAELARSQTDITELMRRLEELQVEPSRQAGLIVSPQPPASPGEGYFDSEVPF